MVEVNASDLPKPLSDLPNCGGPACEGVPPQDEHPEFEAGGRGLVGAGKIVGPGCPPGRARAVEDLGGSDSVLVEAGDKAELAVVEVCPVDELLKIFERRRDELRPEACGVAKRIREEE